MKSHHRLMKRCQCWSQAHGHLAKVWGICHELQRKAACQNPFRQLGKQQLLQNTLGKLLSHSPRPDFFLRLLPRLFYMNQQLKPQEELLWEPSRPQDLPAQHPASLNRGSSYLEDLLPRVDSPSGLLGRSQLLSPMKRRSWQPQNRVPGAWEKPHQGQGFGR